MSKPQRYRGLTYEEKMFGGAKPPFPADLMMDPEGNLVAYSDYAALAAENERLRKAGDAMQNIILNGGGAIPALVEWKAAKEGRDVK